MIMYNELYMNTFTTQLTIMYDVMYDVNVWMGHHVIHYSVIISTGCNTSTV